MARILCVFTLSAAVLFFLQTGADAQQTVSPGQTPSQQLTPGPTLPDPYKLNMMIRSSIIALNQANQTGNYTVLQDLGAPSFRASNNSARLAQIFASLRQRNRDLTPILFFQPKLIRQPHINPNGILRLTGYFATAPERVNFDLFFQLVEGDWRIFGIGVTTTPAEVTAAIAPQSTNRTSTPNPASDEPNGTQQSHVENSAAAGTLQTNREKLATTPPKAPPPARKPQSRSSSSKANDGNASDDVKSAVKNGTIKNATRIDLSDPQSGSRGGSQEEPPPDSDAQSSLSTSDNRFWDSFNPFSR